MRAWRSMTFIDGVGKRKTGYCGWKKAGGLWHRTRWALKKRRRALPSNTVGFEKKAAGFTIKHGGLWKKHGGLCHRTRRALKKSRRALASNTAGFEKKGGGPCDATPQAFHQTFTCIHNVIIVYYLSKVFPGTFGEVSRGFFENLKTPKRQKVTMSPFFWHFSWRWWAILLIIKLFIWFLPLMYTLFLSRSVQLLRRPFLW